MVPTVAHPSLIVLALWLVCPTTAMAEDVDRFIIGFEAGGASVGFSNSSGRHGSVTAGLRLGYRIHTVTFHVEAQGSLAPISTAVSNSFGNQIPVSSTWGFANFLAGVTYSPRLSGVFIRGTIGIGHASAKAPEQGWTSTSETGVAFQFAGGYGFRVAPRLLLVPQVQYTQQQLDTLGASEALGGAIGLSWEW